MVRLVERAKTARTDPELFAGLVHVCRYCGLLEASVAAHQRASQLDPTVRTSVCHTYLLLGDYHRALEMSREVLGYVGPLALISLGRQQEAVALARRMEQTSTPFPLVRCAFSAARALWTKASLAILRWCAIPGCTPCARLRRLKPSCNGHLSAMRRRFGHSLRREVSEAFL